MDEQEFRSILQLFPVVRSRDHRVDLDSSVSKQSTSVVERECDETWNHSKQVSVSEPKDLKDCRTDQDTFTFWDKLRAAAAKKVIVTSDFVQTFQVVCIRFRVLRLQAKFFHIYLSIAFDGKGDLFVS
ncbi:unnamed protein product [Brassica napus]|uniref:(rape) hypothetical protein n=1 Tax=Brassica napus TaxID=3708 RepID=A0A816JIM6_BRANA|nr:unnamed protein product [Brassica napus]